MKHLHKALVSGAITSIIGVIGVSAIGTPPTLQSQRDFSTNPQPEGLTKNDVRAVFDGISKKHVHAPVAENQPDLNEGDVYAYLGGGSFSKTMGMYKLFQDGGYEYMWTEQLLDKSFVMQTGWLRDGNLCGFAQFGVGSWVLGYAYEELNLATGEDIIAPRLIDLDDNYLGYYQIAAYNPDNDRIYGYGYVEKAGDQSVFKSSPASEPDKATIVKPDYVPAEACLALCYNDEKGVLAGINLNHQFVYIDLEGNQNPVMDIGIEGLQNVVSAMTWSAADGYYIFNAIIDGSESELYAIDPEDESVTQLSTVSDGLTFAFMVSPYGGISPEAPVVPVISRLSFEEGENDGMLVFTLPTTNGKGELLDSELEYQVWVDGNIWERSHSGAGELVCVSFNNLSDGEHVFRVAASYDGRMSPKATVRQYIGHDTPKAPTNVSMSFNRVEWNAVTEGEHGGYLDLADMTYDVYLNEEWIDSTSDTFLEIELPEGEITPYNCYVYASCSGKESEAGVSNTIVFGDPLELDVEIIPDEEQAEIVTVLDANSDGSTWHPRNYQGSIVFSYYTDPENCGDDWLFMPGISFDDADAFYNLSFENCYYLATKPEEYFEVWLCKAPDVTSEHYCILGKTQPVSNKFEETTVGFSIPSAGVWYVAFRAVSNPDQAYLNIKNIRISKTSASIQGPSEVIPMSFKDMTVGDNYMSEVTFKMPETLINGETISADEMIIAYVEGKNEVKVEGAPGGEVTATVEVTEGFSNVKISTQVGEYRGAEKFMKVYAGPDVPGRINDFKADVSADNKKVTLSWNAPTTGANGGCVDPDNIKYQLMVFNGKIWRYLSTEIIDTTCVYEPEDTETLQNYPFSIDASNDKGSNDYDQPVVIAQLGTPLTLPLTEDFQNSEVNVKPLAGYAVGDFKGTQWGIGNPGMYGEDFVLNGRDVMIGSASFDGATGRLLFPKFSSLDVEKYIGVKLLLWTGEESSDIKLYALHSDSEEVVEIKGIEKGAGWREIEFTLPAEMSGHSWVQLWIDAEYVSESDHTMLGEYMIYKSDNVGGIETLMDTDIIVMGVDGAIEISSQAPLKKIDIWNLEGTLVKSLTSTQNKLIVEMPKGFYIVRADDMVRKVFVK